MVGPGPQVLATMRDVPGFDYRTKEWGGRCRCCRYCCCCLHYGTSIACLTTTSAMMIGLGLTHRLMAHTQQQWELSLLPLLLLL